MMMIIPPKSKSTITADGSAAGLLTAVYTCRQMPKREAERLASEIWFFKDEADAVAATPVTLAEATALFLERRFFAIPRLVTEVGGRVSPTHSVRCTLCSC
jgi:hypothetical protein